MRNKKDEFRIAINTLNELLKALKKNTSMINIVRNRGNNMSIMRALKNQNRPNGAIKRVDEFKITLDNYISYFNILINKLSA